MFVLVLGNQKGGAGKTTSSVNIAAIAAEGGLRVLVVDIDPQGHSTLSFHRSPEEGFSLGELLDTSASSRPAFDKVVIRDVAPGKDGGSVDLLPSAERPLERAEQALDSDPLGGLMAVKNLLDSVADQYDLAVVDSPPRLTSLAVGPLVAADAVVIPMEAASFHYLSTKTYIAKVDQVAHSPLNPGLRLLGLLLNKFDPEAEETREILEIIDEEGWPLLAARIPSSRLASKVVMKEQLPAAVSYAHSPFAQAFRDATNEIIDRLADLADEREATAGKAAAR